MSAAALKDIDELLKAKLSEDTFGNLIETLLGLSLNVEFCDELVSNYPSIIISILKYTVDPNKFTNSALEFLINVSSHSGAMSKVIDSKPYGFSEFVELIVNLVLKSSEFNVKYNAAQLLSNLSRENTSFFEEWRSSSKDSLNKLFEIGFFHSDTEDQVKLKDDSLMTIMNLSREDSCQKFIMDNLYYLDNALTIFESSSQKWMLAFIGIMKNLLKNSSYHEDLLTNTDLLVILLAPLVGLNNYDEKVYKDFPEKLRKYMGTPKEVASDLRQIILESLYLVSATKCGRNRMRSCNVYDVLKNMSELDLNDEESDNCLDCIGLLIRTEEEIGFDDLLTLQIPENVQDSFNK